eukprot:GFKZ01001056.1.p3 GENE.GFKZ01001056.1~~GFKZ01001056.1.p3  ORF type:complete len:106 (+),score=14.65 GFKZ01001056.1:1427-1744(+)
MTSRKESRQNRCLRWGNQESKQPEGGDPNHLGGGVDEVAWHRAIVLRLRLKKCNYGYDRDESFVVAGFIGEPCRMEKAGQKAQTGDSKTVWREMCVAESEADRER